MSELTTRIDEFIAYASTLSGDEKGEAQVFCDRLFKAFGHGGYKEAGATLESRVRRKDRGVGFADLLWPGRVLIEMKKRGEPLARHRDQAFDYWIHAVPKRPRYVVLCNFDEFWIYDFDTQIVEPVDRVPVRELGERHTALNFLFPNDPRPLFGNNREAVSREAAEKLAAVFHSLIDRGIDRVEAQKYVLRLVVAMFSEDLDLLPSGLVTGLLQDALAGGSSYDLIGGLFRQMNDPQRASGGRYKDVAYFNGGLYASPSALELTPPELGLLVSAAEAKWQKVDPAVFGTLFQSSMDAKERHAAGAHFTAEADIRRVIQPTIVNPWLERIDGAKSAKALLELRAELTRFRVLDPACGSGNFLYVAYRALGEVESTLLERLQEKLIGTRGTKRFWEIAASPSLLSPRQFYGYDVFPFAVELAKVTLLIAKKLVRDAAFERLQVDAHATEIEFTPTLPLDNLDANIRCEDALFATWPEVETIVSNPPFQSKNKMQEELGRPYVNKVRRAFPGVPGRADYCVYWLRRAHDALKPGARAGMVGTNTIRQNYSREGGLDYIVANGGTITDAVSSQVWSGDAVVHVSIVNWVKGSVPGPMRLSRQVGDALDSPWESTVVPRIDSALSFGLDVTNARALLSSKNSKACYQGQTHGHEGFLLERTEAEQLLSRAPELRAVVHPFLIADDLLGELDGRATRFVIDFGDRDQVAAGTFKPLFQRIKDRVLPDRVAAAAQEDERNRAAREAHARASVAKHHAGFLSRWWQLSYRRADLIQALGALPRYIACSRVTKRPIFAFVCSQVRPNDALAVFPLVDDYSFGILQSGLHWEWFKARCSTMKGDWRYTSNSVFDTFAWPQTPKEADALAVASASRELRAVRATLQAKHGLSLRDLYRALDVPGKHPVRDAQVALDEAVDKAYGRPAGSDALAFLLELNAAVAAREAKGEAVQGPGLPAAFSGDPRMFSEDCVAT